MKKVIVYSLVISFLFTSCATIVGGSNYSAYVSVKDHPRAKIYYKGIQHGQGNAMIRIPRRDANKLVFKVQEEGCPEQEILYSTRKFRVGSFVLSLLFFSVSFVPVGVITDFATGAYYKPDKFDPSIMQTGTNNFNYQLEYSTCDTKERSVEYEKKSNQKTFDSSFKTKEQKLIELKELFDSGMITQEEHEKARLKIISD